MIDAAAKAYAAAVRPIRDASETRQGFAKGLRQVAAPLARLARPSDDGDVATLDALVAAKLIETGILPGTSLGHFARRRVHES